MFALKRSPNHGSKFSEGLCLVWGFRQNAADGFRHQLACYGLLPSDNGEKDTGLIILPFLLTVWRGP